MATRIDMVSAMVGYRVIPPAGADVERLLVDVAIKRLVRAIEGGAPFEPLNARLRENTERKSMLQAEPARAILGR